MTVRRLGVGQCLCVAFTILNLLNDAIPRTRTNGLAKIHMSGRRNADQVVLSMSRVPMS